MAGLDINGFTPDTLENIKSRIESKLEVLNPGFDFAPESPDGQLIGIVSFELATVWAQLSQVYESFDPSLATGAALRNLGLITGVPYGTANRSYATVETTGTAGTVIPALSVVSDDDGNEFFFTADCVVPATAEVICSVAGLVPVPAGTIKNIQDAVTGWATVAQATDGVIGTLPMSETEYANRRGLTVQRNYVGTVDTMKARLHELGVPQVSILNNDSTIVVDGVPANTIRVTVGELGLITDQSIASVILETNSAGCPTFGTTTEAVLDNQGYSHDVNFVKATAVTIEIVVDVTFLSDETAGAAESIVSDLLEYINSLEAGEDVVWSHLFQHVTKHAEAQVNTLTVGKAGGSQAQANVVLTDTEYAYSETADITYTET